MLEQQLARVRQRIEQVCQRCGRQPSAITLVGVTKGVTVDVMREAVALGLADLGENRVQEARAKQIALGWGLGAEGSGPEPRTLSPQPVKWHLIGHLQRNKAKDAVELFNVIQSVDSLALIDELEHQATSRRLQASEGNPNILEVFVQVNISGETTKFGCAPKEAKALVGAVMQRSHLCFLGLMTIAPFSEDPETARPHFRNLRILRDELVVPCSLQPEACSLSMGMSQDFEVAIEEGADVVRIGTAIFGLR